MFALSSVCCPPREEGPQMRTNPMPDLRSTLRGVLEKALQETGGVRGSIVLVDPTHGDLVILEKIDPQGP